MSAWSKTIQINAPIEKVFDVISKPERFQIAVPDIVSVAFLTTQHEGKGTRFKETRVINKRKVSTILEIADLKPMSHVQFISEAGGTLWDSTFSTEQEKDGVQLRLVMTASPKHFLAKMALGMMTKMVSKALEKDLEAVKRFCES